MTGVRALTPTLVDALRPMVPSHLIATCVFNLCSRRVCVTCVRARTSENHRTDTSFENSRIVKVSLFQFINSYISLFYIAFIKGRHKVFDEMQYCINDDCLGELYVPFPVPTAAPALCVVSTPLLTVELFVRECVCVCVCVCVQAHPAGSHFHHAACDWQHDGGPGSRSEDSLRPASVSGTRCPHAMPCF
jgi:hypothetical protein